MIRFARRPLCPLGLRRSRRLLTTATGDPTLLRNLQRCPERRLRGKGCCTICTPCKNTTCASMLMLMNVSSLPVAMDAWMLTEKRVIS